MHTNRSADRIEPFNLQYRLCSDMESIGCGKELMLIIHFEKGVRLVDYVIQTWIGDTNGCKYADNLKDALDIYNWTYPRSAQHLKFSNGII